MKISRRDKTDCPIDTLKYYLTNNSGAGVRNYALIPTVRYEILRTKGDDRRAEERRTKKRKKERGGGGQRGDMRRRG